MYSHAKLPASARTAASASATGIRSIAPRRWPTRQRCRWRRARTAARMGRGGWRRSASCMVPRGTPASRVLERDEGEMASIATTSVSASAGTKPGRLSRPARRREEAARRRPRRSPAPADRRCDCGPATGRAPGPARTGSRCSTLPAPTRWRAARAASAEATADRRRRAEPQRRQEPLRGQEIGAPHQPRAPVRADEDVVEALGPLQIGDEEHRRDEEEHQRNRRAHDRRQRNAIAADERQQQADQHRAGRDAFREQVQRHVEAPRLDVRSVVVDARRRPVGADPAPALPAGAAAPGLPCR